MTIKTIQKIILSVLVVLAFFAIHGEVEAAGCTGTGNCYWVGGTGNANDTTKWATASGGATTGGLPGATDNCVFDTLSQNVGDNAYTFTVNAATTCLNFTMAGPGSGNNITWAGSSTLAISGSMNLSAGTTDLTNSYTGTITFNATSGTKTITTNGVIIRRITLNGAGGTFQLADNLSLSANNAGALTLTNGTFDATTNNTTVTLTGTVGASTSVTGTFTGSNSFYNLTKTGASVISDSLTLTGNITCTGTFTVNGNSAGLNRVIVQSSVAGTSRTITAATVVASNVDFQDITGAGAGSWNLSAITGNSGDAGGNSGITFTTPATQTWSGTSGGNWSANAWTTRVPLPQDDVVINAAFSASQTITGNLVRLGKSIDWTGATGTPAFTTGSGTMYGSLTLISGMTYSGTITFSGRSSFTLTTAGKTFSTISITAPSGTLTLQDDLTSTAGIAFNNGTFDANGNDVTITAFSSSNSNTRTLTMGSGIWTLTGNNTTIWSFSTTTGLTLNRGSAAVISNYSGATGTRTIACGTLPEASAPSFSITAGTDTIALGSGSTIFDLDFTGFSGSLTSTARTIYGDLTISSTMTLTAGNNNTTFAATSGTQIITSNGKNFDFPIIFAGAGGTFQLADNLAVGTTTVRGITLTAGTLDLNDKTITHFGTLSVTGSTTRVIDFKTTGVWDLTQDTASSIWSASGSNFTTSGTGTIKISGSTTNSRSFLGGGFTYHNIWFSNATNAGQLVFYGSNTFNDIRAGVEGNAQTLMFIAGTTTTINTFTVSGTTGNLITINSHNTDIHTLVKSGGGTISSDYLNIQHSVATPSCTWFAGVNSTDNQAVATAGSGWTFTAPAACGSRRIINI